MDKSIYIIGDGLLGKCLYKYFLSVGKTPIVINRETVDLASTELSDFKNKFKNIFKENDVVINCIGLLKPTIQIVGNDLAVKVNKNFPILLEQMAISIGFRCINFSSDCVFSGNRGLYTELDFCDASDIYALTKDHSSLRTTVIRTSFIGHEEKHKIGLLEFALKNQSGSINGYTNCFWNGLTSLELSKFINNLIDNNEYWSGVKHVYSENGLSKYDILNLVNEVYGLNIKINSTRSLDIMGTKIYGILDRRLSSIYDGNNKIKKSIYDQLKELKEFYT